VSDDLLTISLWLFIAAVFGVGMPAIAAWRVVAYVRWTSSRRPGDCQYCGYSLTGNVSGICPECGTQKQ